MRRRLVPFVLLGALAGLVFATACRARRQPPAAARGPALSPSGPRPDAPAAGAPIGAPAAGAPIGAPASAVGRAPASTPITTIDARVDGRPFPVASAHALSYGGAAVELVLTDGPSECARLASEARAIMIGQRRIALSAARLLLHAADDRAAGRREWYVREVAWPRGRWDDADRAHLTLDASAAEAGRRSRVSIDYHYRRHGSVDVRGELDVIGCGAHRTTTPARPQPDARLTVAGTKLEVRGARLQRSEDRWTLQISTGPLDCSGDRPTHDFMITFALSAVDEAGAPTLAPFGPALVDGLAVMPSGHGEDATRATFAADGPLVGDGVVGISIGGTLGSTFAEPFSLTGRVAALRCAPSRNPGSPSQREAGARRGPG